MKPLVAKRSIDFDDFASRTDHLEGRSLKAYLRLIHHYWRFGKLFHADHDLAGICNVHVSSFRRMKEQLELLFDVDETGLWRDLDLEEDRAKVLRISAVRTQSGAAGGRGRWQQGSSLESAESDAVAMANAIANATEAERVKETRTDPFAMTDAMSSGSADQTQDDDDDDSYRKSSSSSSSSSILDPGTYGGVAFAVLDATANASQVTPPPTASGMASATADATVAAMANGMASLAVDNRAPAQPLIKDGEMLDIFLLATEGNVAQRLRNVTTMRPYRELMRQGCDLQLHIMPEWEGLRTLRVPLQQPCPPWFRDQILARRDAPAQDTTQAPRGNPAQLVWVEKDSPQDKAWRAHRMRMDGKPFKLMTTWGGKEGWRFPAEWPPGHEPSKAMAPADALCS